LSSKENPSKKFFYAGILSAEYFTIQLIPTLQYTEQSFKNTKNIFFHMDDNGKLELLAGSSLGVYSVASTMLAGAVCPLCVIAAPVLVGAGLVKKARAKAGK